MTEAKVYAEQEINKYRRDFEEKYEIEAAKVSSPKSPPKAHSSFNIEATRE